jgi:hypothetical protein
MAEKEATVITIERTCKNMKKLLLSSGVVCFYFFTKLANPRLVNFNFRSYRQIPQRPASVVRAARQVQPQSLSDAKEYDTEENESRLNGNYNYKLVDYVSKTL